MSKGPWLIKDHCASATIGNVSLQFACRRWLLPQSSWLLAPGTPLTSSRQAVANKALNAGIAGRDERRSLSHQGWLGCLLRDWTGFEPALGGWGQQEWIPRRAQVPGPPAFHSLPRSWLAFRFRAQSSSRLFAYAALAGRGSGTPTGGCTVRGSCCRCCLHDAFLVH